MAGPAAPPRITPWYIRTYDLRFFQNMACILRRGGYNRGMKDSYFGQSDDNALLLIITCLSVGTFLTAVIHVLGWG